MTGNGGVYAVKRRKRPVQKILKPPPVKTNPSKRHRDRLNVELDRLTGLLPFSEEVRGRLDKLSVLRLSVGYLKVKSHFHVALQNRSVQPGSTNGRNGQSASLDGVSFSEGELLLQALNGFVLVVRTDGTVFYTSPTIHDFLGFHQSDVVHQSVFELVHTDDREMFRCQLHFALNHGENDRRAESGQSCSNTSSSSVSLLPQYIPPENSSFLERSFCCRLRCLLDNTSGFLALNFNGRLKYLHLQGNAGADGTAAAPQLALFAIATPVQPPSVMEIRTKTLIFQTKHRMDFAPLGIDTRGKLVLGYTEIELVTTGSGYQFIHAADMMYCADNHLKMIKTGDSGFTFFRLLTKTGHWLWVQASARLVYKEGRPDFIIARQKALTNEEGEEHLHQRRRQLPFNLATGEGVLYETWMDAFSMPGPPGSAAPGTTEPSTEKVLDPASLLGSLCRQDHSIYTQPQTPSPQLQILNQIEDMDLEQPQSSLEQAFLDSHALLSVPGQTQTSQNRSFTEDQVLIDSLEQILGDIGDGGIEGLEVEESELRNWENTLVRMNNEREDASKDVNHILADDVFAYVEEALRREAGECVQTSDQTHVSRNSLSIQAQRPATVFPNNKQPMTDARSGFRGQMQLGDALSGVGQNSGPHTHSSTQCHNTHQGHTSRLWTPNSSNPDARQQSWHPSVQNTNNFHSSCQSVQDVTDQRVRYTPNQTVSQQHNSSLWQQQQLPASFHHHTLTHSSHTPGSVDSFHPQTQRLSGSCMYEKREGHIPNAATVPVRPNGPTHVANAPFTTSCPNVAVVHQRALQPSGHGAHVADGSVCLRGDNDQSGYPPENGSLQSSFFCWNGDAQVKQGRR
ncbi:aryl hydrocarbon receptor-like isoform X2 [Acanthopagrus latus]|uniref:aryl hydrocarbon receptor-like isoform X2 n=1 Tax=Acanthopagrus latus TaxID=8177 RepID=UPI00187CFE84|nr:aryl hydrocarbon receptor-like isoform X2 [Acanthopagrus latus]